MRILKISKALSGLKVLECSQNFVRAKPTFLGTNSSPTLTNNYPKMILISLFERGIQVLK